MPDDPERVSNASEAALEPSERRDLILEVLTLQRVHHEIWGTWIKVQDVEKHLKGERPV